MNMSYCRFHNTNLALSDCVYTLDDIIEGEDTISRDEFIALKNLYQNCISFLEFFSSVDVDIEEANEMMARLEEVAR